MDANKTRKLVWPGPAPLWAEPPSAAVRRELRLIGHQYEAYKLTVALNKFAMTTQEAARLFEAFNQHLRRRPDQEAPDDRA